MTTVTYERGKWIELGKELEIEIRENNLKPKGEKKALSNLFKSFAKKNNTTASSASFYYYNDIKPKLDEQPSKSVDENIETFVKETTYRDPRSYYSRGEILEVVVLRIYDYGVFVKTDEGFEGLLHVSQITGKEYVELPEDYFYVGEKFKAKLVRIDHNGKLSFSTREIGGKDKINPAFKDLTDEIVKEEAPKPVEKVIVKKEVEPNKDRSNIVEFIKKYSDNNVSQKALGDIDDLISEFGVFQTTLSLMETVRDLDISSFITEMTKERLEGEYLRQGDQS